MYNRGCTNGHNGHNHIIVLDHSYLLQHISTFFIHVSDNITSHNTLIEMLYRAPKSASVQCHVGLILLITALGKVLENPVYVSLTLSEDIEAI